MATHVTCKEGEKAVVGVLVSTYLVFLRLFKNNIDPDADSEWADFVEADFPGYAPVALTSSFAGKTDGFDGDSNYWEKFPNVSFTASSAPVSPQLIYGWFLSFQPISLTNKVLHANTFGAPISIGASGDEIKFNFTQYCGDLVSV